jgi:hypothetical protein
MSLAEKRKNGMKVMDNLSALEILKKLADGVDPFTGEVFPDDSPYQNPQTIRSLYTAIDALEKVLKNQERKRSLPDRAGKPWDKEESDLLVKRLDEGIGIAQLAKEHLRTRGAIESQLAKLGKIPERILYRRNNLVKD